MSIADIGQRLRALGITPRALAAWAGTDRIPALPVSALRDREPTPAALALALFVAGRDVAIDKLSAPTAAMLDELLERGLVERDSTSVHAEVAILPVGKSLVVCDRFDAPPTTDRVCWPDDSSYHLAGTLPRARVASWLDLCCGSAFAPLVRPDAAAAIAGVELNAQAAHLARLGVALSGIGHVVVEEADLAAAMPAAALVTCNAPMPSTGVEMWRHTDAALFARLWQVVPERLEPGGTSIVHAMVTAIPYERLAGDRRLVIYTPPDAAPAFGVLWWQPDAADALAITHRLLTPDRPHLDDADRLA